MQRPNPNFQNRSLYQMDNLAVLRGINSGTIDLIATDPPFNKGRDFHATPASLAAGASFQDRWSWKDDVQPVWVEQIEDGWPETHALIEAARLTDEPMAAYLCFMGVRLMEMQRVLKETGSIYLHCDPTANAYLRLLMDTIFGRENFRNEIAWCYTGPGSPKMRQFNRKHDSLLWYSKGAKWTFNADDVRVPYKDPKQTLRKAMDAGKGIGEDEVRRYRERGKILEDWWEGIAIAARGKQNTGYPTQKPLELYERIIKASSNPGDVVFDPFAGCATTCVAAERLGRRWIGADYWPITADLTIKRLNDSPTALSLSDYREAVQVIAAPPTRTDDAAFSAPAMAVPMSTFGFRRRRWSDKVMLQMLTDKFGIRCWACLFDYPDTDYYDLDHVRPKNDGGENDLSNRAVLCTPCNRKVKRASLSLTGVREVRGFTHRNPHPVDIRTAVRWAREQERLFDQKHGVQGILS